MSGSGAALLFSCGCADSGGGMHRDDSTVTWNRQAKPRVSVPYKRKARHGAEKNGNRFQARFIWLQIHDLCATGMLYVGFGDLMTVMKKTAGGSMPAERHGTGCLSESGCSGYPKDS